MNGTFWRALNLTELCKLKFAWLFHSVFNVLVSSFFWYLLSYKVKRIVSSSWRYCSSVFIASGKLELSFITFVFLVFILRLTWILRKVEQGRLQRLSLRVLFSSPTLFLISPHQRFSSLWSLWAPDIGITTCMARPCFNPVVTWNQSDASPSIGTAHWNCSFRSFTILMSLSGMQ